jgi:hypothetical protein
LKPKKSSRKAAKAQRIPSFFGSFGFLYLLCGFAPLREDFS